MSVIVMGMEMPSCCSECELNYDCLGCSAIRNDSAFDRYGFDMDTERFPNCPLRPLPQKHGRLIDADAFKTMCREAVRDICDEVFLPQDIEKVRVLSEVTENLCLDLDEAPAIVEAEGD